MAFWEALFHSFWSVSGYASTSLRSFIYAHDLWSVCDDTLWQVLPNGVLRNHWRCLEAFDVTSRVHDFRLWCCLLVLRLRVELWSHPVFHSVFLHFRSSNEETKKTRGVELQYVMKQENGTNSVGLAMLVIWTWIQETPMTSKLITMIVNLIEIKMKWQASFAS